MNIDDLVGKTVFVKNLDKKEEDSIISIVIGRLRQPSNTERFFIELYMKNNQYCFFGFHRNNIVKVEMNEKEQAVIFLV